MNINSPLHALFGAVVLLTAFPDAFAGTSAPAASQPQTEPSNPKEAAEKKAAQEKLVDERYQAVVAKLPAAQQAWEKVLQDNLGAFYLPLHKRDKVAGNSNAWDFVEDVPGLPRVLLIGDSVSRGYTQAARKALEGKANVHRAPENCGPVANGLKKLDVWLGDKKWDLIHFNFGIHDRGTPLEDYTRRMEELIGRLKKTGARLVWASTTPIPDDASKKQSASSIVERNAALEAVFRREGIVTNDLFAAVTPRLAELQNPNDVHFNGAGYEFLGARVASVVLAQLAETRQPAQAAQPGQAASLAAAVPPAAAPPAVKKPEIEPTHANVAYGAHERQALDFWKAEGPGPRPVFFFIHGGGWVTGDKSGVGGALKECLAAGVSVVSINYRYAWQAKLAGVHPPVEWPVRDAARALQFVRSKAAEWGIDKPRIAASGGSAGACSSLWLAFHKDLADPASADPVARESTRLWCAAVDGAQTSLDPLQLKEWTPNSKYGGHAFGFFDPENLRTRDTRFAEFLAHREELLPLIKEYSPWELATADAPPIYMKYAQAPALGEEQKDPTHTSNYGVKLQEKLRALGVPCELVYPGAPDATHASSARFVIDKFNEQPK